jgi:RNA polymerase sigma-70 factor (ECF subfamily)
MSAEVLTGGESSPAPSVDVSRVAEQLFRHESGKLVSVLTGIFGIEHLQLAEDVVQESLIRALQVWPYYGIPKNPAAWITQTAKHLALDLLRREKRFQEKQPEVIATVENWSSAPAGAESATMDTEISDDRLRLIFTCCHPVLPPDAQIALALKTLCGFSPMEIARAFLISEAAVAKRLTRARQRLQEQRIPFEIPAGAELSERLDGVLMTLYLLFNEGYKASSGDHLVRREMCAEAIHLTSLLASHPAGNVPRAHALLALMLLHEARTPARVDAHGAILRLKEQDRSRWDRAMIASGLRHLALSAQGDEITRFHLQAGIAACHSTAADDPSTDWPQILALYDQLAKIDDTPIVALNRAVALAKVKGPAAGIAAIEAVKTDPSLSTYHLLYAVLAEFESQLGHFEAAAAHLRKALKLAEVKSEQSLLSKRLADLEE